MTGSEILAWIEAQGLHLVGGLVVLIAGMILVRWILRLLAKGESRVRMDPTLKGFLDNLIRILLYTIVILTAASTMGISLSSIIAIVASAGVAVSLAVQGVLSNVVGGVMLLLLKPIRVNEYIKAGETEGTVKRIGTIYTELVTPDNKHISMPNSNLTNTPIINYTREGSRRMDIPFGVAYSSDSDRVRQVLLGICEAYPGKIFQDPGPRVLLNECADSSLKYQLRLWCRTEDYWDLYFGLIEKGKRALDEAGIVIPFPQMDVHLSRD